MKRLFYGSLAIDVSDETADAVLRLAELAASSYHNRSVRVAGGFGTEPYATGRFELVTVSGYIDDEDRDVTLMVGAIPIASAPQFPPRPDAGGTAMTLPQIRAQIAEYTD